MTIKSLIPIQTSPRKQERPSFFTLTVTALKYYLLLLFGFSMSCVLAAIMGAFPVLEPFFPAIWECLWRLAALVLCFVVIAMVLESVRE